MKSHMLWNVLCIELRKALRSKPFWMALAIGMLFSALDLLEQYHNIRQAMESIFELRELGMDIYLGYSMFLSWIGVGGSYGKALLYSVWPAIAAMAFGWSYNSERFNGVYNQIAVRTGVKRYFIAKHTAVFISGGLAFALPVVINLLIMPLIWPVGASGCLQNTSFLCWLDHSHPWLFCFVQCGVLFLLGGAAACMCHVAGTYLRHGVMVVLTPYAILIAIEVVVAMLRENGVKLFLRYGLSPYLMVHPGAVTSPGWILLATLVLMIFGSYAIGYWQVKRNELV